MQPLGPPEEGFFLKGLGLESQRQSNWGKLAEELFRQIQVFVWLSLATMRFYWVENSVLNSG